MVLASKGEGDCVVDSRIDADAVRPNSARSVGGINPRASNPKG
jgi:hypothetical protein